MSVQTCWLSTCAHAWPVAGLVEVKVACDCPNVNELPGGAIVPFDAVKAAFGKGSAVTPPGTTLSELCVMSAVTVELPPGPTELGTALTPRTIQGLKSAPAPFTAPQPVLPGPALQPHQLFSRSTAWLLGLSIAVAAIMRLKWAVTVRGVAELFCNAMPVPRPVMVEDEMPAAAMGPITSRPLSPAPL